MAPATNDGLNGRVACESTSLLDLSASISNGIITTIRIRIAMRQATPPGTRRMGGETPQDQGLFGGLFLRQASEQ
jgi:hypothetical protein